MSIDQLIQQCHQGFSTIKVGDSYKQAAIANIKLWLTDTKFSDYVPQLEHLITAGHFDYLLDCFYQTIPFGTGGRRGEVGIGPNRINPWTIQSSAQGHAQYLLKQYGDEAKTRGIVLTYDVRQFYSNKYFDDNKPNPVRNLNCKNLAVAAAVVYAANGLKVYLFDDVRTTPELSFAIRHLRCVSGDMFSASHNPPEHNGKKVYDEFGGQLIPPYDENLVTEVTEHVDQVKMVDYEAAVANKTIEIVGKSIDEAYYQACLAVSLSSARDIKIVYTPLHGCGSTSVQEVLKRAGYNLFVDPKTSNPSGKFENVTFNIPNPEVEQSFERPLEYAKSVNADIILSSDPDADRIGIMINHYGKWKFINGNEIGGILTRYVIEKRAKTLQRKGVIIKTQVTTNLISSICKPNNVDVIGDLLVGFKYIGDVMNQLEKEGRINDFLMGCEESHGYVAGNYVREKDAVPAALWLAELAAELKQQGKTIIDYLNETYSQYGYFRNFLTEIRLPGAEGMSQIQQILTALRTNKPTSFGDYTVESMEDWLDRQPIVSETDRVSKNAIVFNFKPTQGTSSIKITVRPSGTEPKVKMYYEIGSQPFALETIESIKASTEILLKDLEKNFMKACYRLIGIDFPDRGFLLFWQLPLQSKMKYFEVEPSLEQLQSIDDPEERKSKCLTLLDFLGSDPIQKVDPAFKDKYGVGIQEYLSL
jgi:phosphoglucomutase/phosphomannomutase